MIKEVLLSLGMTNNEIEVYLTLLKSGSLSVNKIGEKSGLHRQVCYDALERLTEKGFVSYTVQNSKKYFQALSPDKIISYLDEKKETVKEILPNLVNLTKLPREDTFIEVLKGKNVIRTILRDVIKNLKESKGNLMMLGVEETKFMEEDRIVIQQFLRDLKRFKLKERLIARKGAKLYFPGKQSEYRTINNKSFNPNPMYIYGGKIVQVIWGNPVHAVMITNQQVYDSNKKYFEMLWKIAKPLKTKK
jgi:sugar-specific transcriptional regulator TrmB